MGKTLTEAQGTDPVAERDAGLVAAAERILLRTSTLREIPAAIAALVKAERQRAETDMRERALRAVYEQRCERDTPWDLAIVACADAIRSLPLQGDVT